MDEETRDDPVIFLAVRNLLHAESCGIFTAKSILQEKCSILFLVQLFPKGTSLNYVIDQVAADAKHAGSKARDDVNSILQSRGFSKELVECSYDPGIGPILKDTYRVPRQMKRIVKSLEKGSFFVVQFPFRCFSAHLGKQICRIAHGKDCFAVALIHDLSALRNVKNGQSIVDNMVRNEIVFLSEFDCIIAHNAKMKRYLVDRGLDEKKIIELELFDYLVPENETQIASFSRKITVAGNLQMQKARYLHLLQNLPEKAYEIDLLGTNWKGPDNLNGVHYKGSFKPDEITSHISEGFGLVWDGDSLDGCTGEYGSYLRYNNPHKLSSYLASGIPVITWEEAAVSSFVVCNGIGAAVSSLRELNGFFDQLTEEAYFNMVQNVQRIREKVISGGFLRAAIDKAVLASRHSRA